MNKNRRTLFQENFCLAYIKAGNASNAYRAVSVKSHNWNDNTLWVAASRMMARSKVRIRISELRAGMATRAIASAESLADELDATIAMARECGQPGVCVAAIMGKAKLFGLLTDKKETRTGYLDDLSFEQLRLIHDLIRHVKGTEQPPSAEPDEHVP